MKLWKHWATFAFALCIGYHSIAFGVWQWRNPKANAMTFYSHYPDVMKFHKLEKFQ